MLGPLNGSGYGQRRHFIVAPPQSPHAWSTATVDGTSATKGLASHISASSDLSLLARVTITWLEFMDREACCELHDERERERTGERESATWEKREVKDEGLLARWRRHRHELTGEGNGLHSSIGEEVKKRERNVGAPTCKVPIQGFSIFFFFFFSKGGKCPILPLSFQGKFPIYPI